MAYEGQQNGDVRAILALSQAEAREGTTRTLNLPGGYQVVVPVPPGTYNGQEIRLEGQGQPSGYGGSRGALILTIAIAPGEQFVSQTYPQPGSDSPTEFIQSPPPVASSVNYPPIGSRGQMGAFTSSPSRPSQQPFYADQTQQSYPPRSSYSGQQQYSPPQQAYPPPSPGPQRRRGLSTGMVILFIVLALLIIGGSGLILYTAVIQPNQLHTQATATAQANVTTTAQSNATGTAQAAATATIEANATTTAQAQATAHVQATATALQAIFNQATSGTPALNDPLSQQDTNSWEVDDKTGGGGCAFTGGSYHASMPQAGFFASCYAQNSNFSNFAFQIQMTILKGDRGGIIFRSDSAATKFYLLRFDQNGTYNFFVYSGNSGSNAKNLLEGSAPSFHTGAKQANQIAVVARGSNIYLYVNQQYLTSLSDSTYSSGSIAVFAEDHTNSTEVAFSNAQVWNL